jgi:two-component system, response regulator, stage 0 sporulation protein F
VAVAGVRRRVLIEDDNVVLAENIAEVLQLDGHLTQVAGSAEEGLAMVLADEPDLVVSDFRLPGMNGAVFVKEVCNAHVHVQAVVISAYTDDGTIGKAKDAGATFMSKPLDLDLLSRWAREA